VYYLLKFSGNPGRDGFTNALFVIFIKITAMKKLSILAPIFSAFLLLAVFNSCQKPSSLEPVMDVTVKTATDQPVYSVMNYEFSESGAVLNVVFYESQRIYALPASAAEFKEMMALIEASKSQHMPLKVEMGAANELKKIGQPTPQEVALFNARFTETETIREEYEDVISSIQELNEIFEFITEQNCADGNSILKYCIPFQFKIDGCYARAHKMKQILELHYGYTCSKIFSFQKNLHPLAVNAGDCCILWGWHDAPVVKVNTPAGIESRVIDPSLFDHPVSIKEWLDIQSDESCEPKAGAGKYEIVPGSYYFSDGTKDPDYSQTNFILALYKNLPTCP
jgi:hypothetical protein